MLAAMRQSGQRQNRPVWRTPLGTPVSTSAFAGKTGSVAANTLSFWGKALPLEPGSGPQWHPLPYHCLDVAAVGEAVLTRHHGLRHSLSSLLDLPAEIAVPVTCFLCVHDIGKFARCTICSVCPRSCRSSNASAYGARLSLLPAWPYWQTGLAPGRSGSLIASLIEISSRIGALSGSEQSGLSPQPTSFRPTSVAISTTAP